MLCFRMQQHFSKSFLGWQSFKDLHQLENLSAKLFLGTPSPNDFPPENDTQEFAKVWGPSNKVLSARRQLGAAHSNSTNLHSKDPLQSPGRPITEWSVLQPFSNCALLVLRSTLSHDRPITEWSVLQSISDIYPSQKGYPKSTQIQRF